MTALLLLAACWGTAPEVQYLWPMGPGNEPYPVLTTYGQLEKKTGGTGSLHKGLDLGAPHTEPVYALESGRVARVVADTTQRGTTICIESDARPGEGFLYTHIDEDSLQYAEGEVVSIDAYLGDVAQWPEPIEPSFDHLHIAWIEGEEDPEDPARWSSWRVLEDPLGWFAWSGLDRDEHDPVVHEGQLEDASPDWLHFALDGMAAYSTKLSADWLGKEVDLIARISDRAGDGSAWDVMPRSIVLRYRPGLGQDVAQEWHILLAGPLGGGNEAKAIYKNAGALKSQGGRNLDEREFHVVLTNGVADPATGERPDGDHSWKVETLTPVFELTVTDSSGREALRKWSVD